MTTDDDFSSSPDPRQLAKQRVGRGGPISLKVPNEDDEVFAREEEEDVYNSVDDFSDEEDDEFYDEERPNFVDKKEYFLRRENFHSRRQGGGGGKRRTQLTGLTPHQEDNVHLYQQEESYETGRRRESKDSDSGKRT